MYQNIELQILSFLDATTDSGILFVNKDNEIIFATQTVKDQLGEPPTVGQNVKEFLKATLSPTDQIDEFVTRHQLRPLQRVRLFRQTLNDERHQAIGTILSIKYVREDLSGSLKEAHLDLIEAREAAVHSARVKSDFLSNMSHEIRTPLNAIIGMTELLTETHLSQKQRKMLDVLLRGGRALLDVVNDILSLAQLESGTVHLQREPFDLHALAYSVGDLGRSLARGKPIRVHVELTAGLPHHVIGDAKRLQQVLLNFVSNATKFTSEGEIVLKLSPHTGKYENHITFSVADTGIGIPEDKIAGLFERFTQLQDAATKSFAGTGLGLAISKQIVEMMDGTIWIESTPGVGSTFYFSVPLPHADSSHTEESFEHWDSSPKTLAGLNILLVEDSEDNAFLISMFLKDSGCRLEYAVNGREAIKKFSRCKFDMILMDMQMPEMDGYSATRWIRALEKNSSRNIPILALTAFSQPEEICKSLDAGCDDHLSKPLAKPALLRTMIRLRDRSQGRAAQRPQDARPH